MHNLRRIIKSTKDGKNTCNGEDKDGKDGEAPASIHHHGGAGAGARGLVRGFLVLGQKDHYGWLGLVQTLKVLKGQNDLMARSNFSCFK